MGPSTGRQAARRSSWVSNNRGDLPQRPEPLGGGSGGCVSTLSGLSLGRRRHAPPGARPVAGSAIGPFARPPLPRSFERGSPMFPGMACRPPGDASTLSWPFTRPPSQGPLRSYIVCPFSAGGAILAFH